MEEVENGEVEKNSVEGVVEKENDHGVVENEKKDKNSEGEKSEPLIDADSMLGKSKSQLLKEMDLPQVVPSFVNLPYPHLAKKKKKKEGQFKKFMELFSQLQVNIPFREALDQMVYAKFMKELLTGRRKPKDDENIELSENCSAILQRKLPPKMKDLGVFTIPCTVGNVNIGRALCDLGASINLIPLSIMKKLGCGEPKHKRMTLTLAYRTISYPYGVLEDVLVQVNDLVFPAHFVILDMAEDEEMSLLLERPFLATVRALIDVEMGELILRFQDEQVVFHIFEAMKHRTENPQCYQIDVVEEIVEDDSRDPQPTQPMKKVIVNSIEGCDKDEDFEVKECIKKLEASKEEVDPMKVEDLMVEDANGAPRVLKEGGEVQSLPKLKELPSHLKYVFLTKDDFKPVIINNSLTPLEENKLMRVLM